MAKSRARKLADLIVGAGIDIDGNLTFDGGSTSADLTFADGDKANFGDASDLQIFHNGSHSFIKDAGTGDLYIGASNNLALMNSAFSENYLLATTDGAVTLYYDGSSKLATTSTGVTVTGTTLADAFNVSSGGIGTGYQLNGSTVLNYSGGNVVVGDLGAGVLLEYNGSTKLSTTSSGATITGTLVADGLTMGDNELIQLGTGNDLRIYHDGSHSRILENGTGNLIIQGTNLDLADTATGETFLRAVSNDSVEIYYDGSKKFETTSSGVDVTGGLTSSGNVTLAGTGNKDVYLGTTGSTEAAYISRYNNDFYLMNKDSGDLIFGTNNSNKGRFTSSGNFQIGTTTVIDSSRNLTNIGTISSGNITSSGTITAEGGELYLGEADTASAHINSYEVMTFNIDSDNDDTNRYFGWFKNGNSGSGTSLMRLTEDGYLGIGTTSPSHLLHVSDSSYDTTLLGLSYSSSDSSAADYAHYGELLIQGGSTYNKAGIRGYANSYQTGNAALAFWTQEHSGSYAERMRIMGDGQVRIDSGSYQRPIIESTNWGYSAGYRVALLGSASTTYDTTGTGSITLSMGYDPSSNTDGSFTGDGREILFRRGAQFVTPNSADDDFYLYNLVLRDGKVGIGAAPSYQLHVTDTKGDVAYIASSDPDGNGATNGRVLHIRDNYATSSLDSYVTTGWTSSPGQDVYIGKRTTSGAGYLAIKNSSGTEHFTIDMVNGHVGINKTSGFTAGGFTSPRLVIKQTANSSWGGINVESSADDSVFAFGATDTVHYIASSYRASGGYKPVGFLVGGTERMRITSAGKIGIGASSPEETLHVVGKGTFENAGNVNRGNLILGPHGSGTPKWATLAGTHYNEASGSGNGSGNAGIMLIGSHAQSGSNQIYIGHGPYELNPATHIRLGTHSSDTHNLGGTTHMIIDSAGNVGIGTASPTGAKLHVAGGIKGTDLIAHDSTGINLQTDEGTKRLVVLDSGGVVVGGTSADTSSSMGGQTPVLFADGYSSLGGLRINGADTGNTIYKTGGALGITLGDGNAITLSHSSGTARLASGHWEVLDAKQLRAYRSGNSAYGALYMDTGENLFIYNSWGAKSIVLDRDGNVGIGTSDPAVKMHIVDSDGEGLRLENQTAAPTNSVSNAPHLEFFGRGWDSNYGSKPIKARIEHTATYGDYGYGATQGALVFSVQGAGGINSAPDTMQEGMRIAAGSDDLNHPRVGIGEGNPGAQLQIQNGSQIGMRFDTNSKSLIRLLNNSVGLGERTDLGIGFSAISGYGGTYPLSGVTGGWDDDTSGGLLSFRTSTDGGTTWPSRMVIKHDGKVGIGTSSPDAQLDVSRGADTSGYNTTGDQRSEAGITVRNTSEGTNVFSGINLYTGAGTGADWSINNVRVGNYLGDLTFKTRTGGSTWAEYARITHNGTVGLGTTTPITPSHKTSTVTAAQSTSNGWSVSTSGVYSARGAIEVAGITNRHIGKFGLSGNFSANTWYPIVKRSDLVSMAGNTESNLNGGFGVYFRIYAYTSSIGGGEYLANRVTETVWITDYGSNSNQTHEMRVGAAFGHAPNTGHNADDPSLCPIRMRIAHHYGSDSTWGNQQTIELNLDYALTGADPAAAGKQLIVYAYMI